MPTDVKHNWRSDEIRIDCHAHSAGSGLNSWKERICEGDWIDFGLPKCALAYAALMYSHDLWRDIFQRENLIFTLDARIVQLHMRSVGIEFAIGM